MNILVDFITVGLLIFGIAVGAKRGFIKSIAGLLVVILSLVGATILSGIVTDPITDFVYPRVEESVTSKLKIDAIDLSGNTIVDRAIEQASGTATEMLRITAQSFVRSIVHAASFLLCFLILTLLLRLLLDVVDKAFDLPLLSSINAVLGAVFGLLETSLVLFLVPYLARHLGIDLFEQLSVDTSVFTIFVHNSPFDLINLLLINGGK